MQYSGASTAVDNVECMLQLELVDPGLIGGGLAGFGLQATVKAKGGSCDVL